MNKLPGAMVYGVGKEMSRAVSASSELQKQITSFIDSVTAGKELLQVVRPGDMVFLKGSRGMTLEKICPA